MTKNEASPKCGEPCPFTSYGHVIGCELSIGHRGKHRHTTTDPLFFVEWGKKQNP